MEKKRGLSALFYRLFLHKRETKHGLEQAVEDIADTTLPGAGWEGAAGKVWGVSLTGKHEKVP